MIFIQDIKGRAVYWILFPLLAIVLFCSHALRAGSLSLLWLPALINSGFVVLQLVLVTVYFSVRQKRLVNIVDRLLGLGDIFFLLSIAFYLSIINFLFFYIISLITSLFVWVIWQMIAERKTKHIPLAGLQAMLFILFLTGDWWVKLFDLTNDAWLLNLVSK